MKDGDIYFWKWKNDIYRFMPYHCLSCKAIARDGQLVDTFWHDSDNRVLSMDEIDAEFMGNEHDMSQISKREIDYYRREDVVDMRHANNSSAPIYVKVGAQRDPAVILEHLRYQVEKTESAIRSAQHDIKLLNGQIEAVNAGRLADVYM